MKKRVLIVLLLFVLPGIATNLAIVWWVIVQPGKPWRSRSVINLIGPEAATMPLPVRTPHAQPWPPAHQWSESASFAHRRFGTWHVDAAGATSHQIQADYYGWPLAALEHVQFWWPWNDPAWTLPRHGDSGLRATWPGMVVNPLVLGVPVGLVLTSPMWWRALVRARRRRRGLCLACGYDLAGITSGVCPECGGTSLASAAAASPTVPTHD